MFLPRRGERYYLCGWERCGAGSALELPQLPKTSQALLECPHAEVELRAAGLAAADSGDVIVASRVAH